eukprot:TRINITY_DN10704_c0_g1_i1.p1 TRINITY_DN10704_c0_g1~~TRINITY_DN10704_c0_g1_i1.p1  ORF type:complete len:568 (-),score=95.83 TRINITY_DN10704_c0_g1_i1:409-2112(-)
MSPRSSLSGNGCTINNLALKNVNITSNNGFVGALVGDSYCGINNVVLTTTSSSIKNVINGLDGVGGLVGRSSLGLQNITVEQTVVNGRDYVGGVLGAIFVGSYNFLYNFGFKQNDSEVVVCGRNYVGGMVGVIEQAYIQKSGITRGTIKGNNYVGAILGYLNMAYNTNYFYNLYAYSAVTVNTNGTSGGGIFGRLACYASSQVYFANCYSKASIIGAITGGFGGEINTGIPMIISFTNVYTCSNVINTTSESGNFLGKIATVGVTITFNNSYYNNEYNLNLDGIGIGNSSDGSTVSGYNCSQLYYSILQNYPNNTWGGNALLTEFNYSYGIPCIPQTTFPPSTSIPSTLVPSTLTPSTLIPSTNIPSILTPSTLTPSSIPSTLIPSTLHPSTSFPSTLVPSTKLPLDCVVNVPNCNLCPKTIIQLDFHQFNISCVFFENQWIWSFQNKNNDNVIFDSLLEISNSTLFNSSVLFSRNSSLIFNFSQNEKTTTLLTNGNITLNGTILVNILSRPNTTNITLILLQSSNNSINLVNSQIKVVSNYTNSKCDKLNFNPVSQQSTLAINLNF